MHTIADTRRLTEDGVISAAAARIIHARAREIMVKLAVNAVLCTGILFATSGLIFWLADAFAVALFGGLFVAAGVLTLNRASVLYSMFGSAAVLIGAGMLISGAGVELLNKHEDAAGWVMSIAGGSIACCAAWTLWQKRLALGFVTGSILLMSTALHLFGLGLLTDHTGLSGAPVAAFWLYAAATIAIVGWYVDVRLVSALAIVPFSQALDTGTFYFYATYAFYSPEPALSILQMSGLIAGMLWIAGRVDERSARHSRMHVVIGFVVANLCVLVGSLWGDVVGDALWGPGQYSRTEGVDYSDWQNRVEMFKANALVIHEHVFSVLWALALAAIMVVAARRNWRGLFNAAVTFGAIHAYTQAFESFHDEPLAYAIGGFVAIALAWGMFRLNLWFLARSKTKD